jgi:hypothetical protein
MTAQPKALTVFARSNAGIVVPKPSQDICVRVYSVFVLCVQVAALRRANP